MHGTETHPGDHSRILGSAPETTSRSGSAHRSVAIGSLFAVVGFSVWMLVTDATPPSAVGAYLLYLVLGVAAPGTIVHKALRGSTGSWLADLSLGATTGLALELVAWAAASLLDVRGLLWAWPLLTLPLLIGHHTRTRVFERPTRRWTWGPTVAVAMAVLQAIWITGRPYLSAYDLPPTSHPYYPDLLWHMGLAWEARRSFPLGTPQVVGDGPLIYHWFSNAHVAAGSLITGIDVPVVMLELWFVPIVALTVILTAVLTERLTGKPWAAALAGSLVFPYLSYPFWPGVIGTSNALTPLSPSQLFSVPLTLLLLHTISDLLSPRRGPRGGQWAVLVLSAVAATGAKASALPVVVGGIGFAFLAALVMRRSRLVLLGIGLVLSGFTALALKFVAGGSAGSGIQLFSALSILLPYRELIASRPDFNRPVLDGLVNAPGVGPILLVGLLLIILVAYLRTFGFILPFLQRPLRTDLSAWVLAGACIAALVPFFVLAHHGYSQYYFLFGVLPFGSVLWAWSLSLLVGDSRSRARTVGAILIVGGAASIALGWYARGLAQPEGKDQALAALQTFVTQVAVGGSLLLATVLFALWIRRHRGTQGLLPVATALLLAPPIAAGPFLSLVVLGTPPAARPSDPQVRAETEAAMWISAHVPERALTATNDHCLARTQQGMHCYSRQWWISGLAGRRVLIESWGYTPRGAVQGYYDPALYALNQSAFTAPTPQIIAAMRARGVTWLVAERDANLKVSPRLEHLTTKRYDNGRVAVFEIAS